MIKRTPGEWKVYDAALRGMRVSQVRAEGATVCEDVCIAIMPNWRPENEEERLANAELIAVIPQMISLVGMVACDELEEVDDIRRMRRYAKKILTKLGRSND